MPTSHSFSRTSPPSLGTWVCVSQLTEKKGPRKKIDRDAAKVPAIVTSICIEGEGKATVIYPNELVLLYGFKGSPLKRVPDVPLSRIRRSDASTEDRAKLEARLLTAIRANRTERPQPQAGQIHDAVPGQVQDAAGALQRFAVSKDVPNDIEDGSACNAPFTPTRIDTCQLSDGVSPWLAAPMEEPVGPIVCSPMVWTPMVGSPMVGTPIANDDSEQREAAPVPPTGSAELAEEETQTIAPRPLSLSPTLSPISSPFRVAGARHRSRTPPRRALGRTDTLEKAPEPEALAGGSAEHHVVVGDMCAKKDVLDVVHFTKMTSRVLQTEDASRISKANLVKQLLCAFSEAAIDQGLELLDQQNKIFLCDDMIFMV